MASQRDLVPITEGKALDELAETEDMSKALVKQCFMRAPGGGIFIKRAGLLYKTEKKFKGVGYSVLTTLPSDEEIAKLKMMGFMAEGSQEVIIKGIVRAAGQEWTDFGTATIANTNSTTRAYLLEMACTRATNRAMRIATVCGFTSTEELPPAADRTPAKFTPGRYVKGVGHEPQAYDGGFDEKQKPSPTQFDISQDLEPDEVSPDLTYEQAQRNTTRLSDEDYEAMRVHLIDERGIAPWFLMNHLKKHYGLQTMSQITYGMHGEVMDLVEDGHFNKEQK